MEVSRTRALLGWFQTGGGGDEREKKFGARILAGAELVGPDEITGAQAVQVAEIIHNLASARQNADTHDLELRT